MVMLCVITTWFYFLSYLTGCFFEHNNVNRSWYFYVLFLQVFTHQPNIQSIWSLYVLILPTHDIYRVCYVYAIILYLSDTHQNPIFSDISLHTEDLVLILYNLPTYYIQRIWYIYVIIYGIMTYRRNVMSMLSRYQIV